MPIALFTKKKKKSTDWAILASMNPAITRERTLTTSLLTHSPILLLISPYKSPVDLHRAHFKARVVEADV